jgi:hypothetical protein
MSVIKNYGPAVLGQKLFDQVQKETAGGKDTFGPAVTGYEEPKEKEPQAPSYLSVRALRSALSAEPRRMDYYLAAEWEREGGPRKSALQLFLDMEGNKTIPREALVARLVEALSE